REWAPRADDLGRLRTSLTSHAERGTAWLPGLRRVDHDPRPAPGWLGGADRPRDLSDALRPLGVAPSIRGPCPRPDRGYWRSLSLYDRSDRAAPAAAGTTMVQVPDEPISRGKMSARLRHTTTAPCNLCHHQNVDHLVSQRESLVAKGAEKNIRKI